MENTSAAIATITAIPAIIRKSKRSAIATIVKIAAIVRSQRSQQLYGNQSSAIVKDHMETEGGLYFGKGSEKFHYIFTFRFPNYFLDANVAPEIIITLDALGEMEILAKINFIKQGTGH